MTERDSDEKTSASTPIVFISYASQDAAVANAITEALERCSLRCWIAPEPQMTSFVSRRIRPRLRLIENRLQF